MIDKDTVSTKTTATQENEQPALVKKIGKTTYIVRVHFSTTNTKTMSDKIKRMLKNEVRQGWRVRFFLIQSIF